MIGLELSGPDQGDFSGPQQCRCIRRCRGFQDLPARPSATIRAYVDTLITDHQASTVGSRSAPSDWLLDLVAVLPTEAALRYVTPVAAL